MNPRFKGVERLLDCRADLGEGAIWSAREQVLYWVNITQGELHRLDPSSGRDQCWQLPTQVGCCAPMDDGRVIVALESGFHAFDPVTEALTPLGRPADMADHLRFNDGNVDPAGRFLAGTLPKAGPGAEPEGNLYVLDGPQAITCLERGLSIQNGLAFSPDGRTLYLADTGVDVQAVWTYDYDVDSGRCANRKLFVDMHSMPGRPDGASVDVDGAYWVAAADGWSVVRFTPAGKVDRVIEVPMQMPTKVAFGGSDLRTLFVTSMAAEVDSNDPQHREAGNLFALNPGVQGLPADEVSSTRLTG